MVNEIFAARRGRVLIPGADAPGDFAVVATMNRNLEALGYTLGEDALRVLLRRSASDAINFYAGIVPVLRKLTGADRRFAPMYPNFPAQVMAASDAELYLNAVVHYLGDFVTDVVGVPTRILPGYVAQPRASLDEELVPLKVLRSGTEQEFLSIFTDLVAANASLSDADKAVVAWFVEYLQEGTTSLIPAEIPQKETLAFLSACIMKQGGPPPAAHFRTATDVLRLAAALSGGDVSLAEPTKFKSFRRRERRLLLGLLDRIDNVAEDVLRRPERWKRLGHMLHAGEYARQYPNAHVAFEVSRGNTNRRTFNSRVEAAIENIDPDLPSLLGQRPGDFARRLDHVLRSSVRPISAAAAFLDVANQVSTPVLVQLRHHLANRPGRESSRPFFPKGDVARIFIGAGLKPIPAFGPELQQILAGEIRQILVERFRKLPPLGRVFLDERLRRSMVPFGMRSASRSLRTVARGSRIPIPDTPTLRFFLWWKQGDSRVDIDLSAAAFTADWGRCEAITYYNLRAFGGYHSGDITSAPNGAAEFIDVDRTAVLERGFRYVAMVLNSYSGQPYCDLPECFAGWMGRVEPRSGEIFEPRTVVDRIDLTAKSRMAVPIIFDMQERQAVWVDLSPKGLPFGGNVGKTDRTLATLGRVMVDLNRPNLYDLFDMHRQARGVPVVEREGADVVFDLATAFEADEIRSKYLI